MFNLVDIIIHLVNILFAVVSICLILYKHQYSCLTNEKLKIFYLAMKNGIKTAKTYWDA